jgi:cytochrome c-type biogenesis protein CcmH
VDKALAGSWAFWCIAGAMTGIALAFVLPRLLARRPRRRAASHAVANVRVYRSQLVELDREFASGLLTDGEHRRARVDLERRLLEETEEDQREPGRARSTPGTAIAIGISLPALAFGLYALFGDPGALRDPQAFEARPDVPSLKNVPALRDELVRHLERSPRDGRGWVLLARLELERDRFAEAAQAYGKAVAASATVARDPAVWCEYADAVGMAQGGTLAGQPREFIARALTLDAAHPKALEMAGSAAFERRDHAAAAGYWRQLLVRMPDNSPGKRELAAAVARAEQLALNDDGARTATANSK